MNKILLASGSLLYLAACSSTHKARVEKAYYGPKQLKYSIAVDGQGRKEGPETWWYPDGTRKYEAINREGFREGKFTAWYPDGKTWYEGFERLGKPESTLTYWHPNGKIKSRAFFRDGMQLRREDFDEQGQPLARAGSAGRSDSIADGNVEARGSALRQASLRLWATRVRQSVEGYWVLPKQFEKGRPYRAVAKIKVARDGKILGVTWMEKSPSSAFNTLAQNTFRRIKRLPAFPPQIKDAFLEVQYEFISLGKPAPRKRIKAREEAPD